MQEMDPLVFLAVFQEMLGPLLWVLLLISGLGTAAFVVLLLRQRRIVARTFMWSQLVGFFGGLLALALMARVSSSGFTDAAGPADWFLIALVFVLGAIGSAIVVYTAVGWIGYRRRRTAYKA